MTSYEGTYVLMRARSLCGQVKLAAKAMLRELEGPFRVDAQICLERQGLEALDDLLTAWKSLAEQNREWPVDWVLRSEVSP